MFLNFNWFLEPQQREVTKPENLFSKLKFNDDYQLFDKNLFNISMPKLIDTDISFVHKDNNDGRYIVLRILKIKD